MKHQLGYWYLAQLALVAFGIFVVVTLTIAHLMAILWARRNFYRKPSQDYEAANLPGVSILKPLVGIDRNVYTNLETYFTLDYPRYELLFCLESDSDTVAMVVETLIDKYPHVDARVLTQPRQCGPNPKVNNMIQGYDCANYDLIMVSDSGVKMRPDTLLDMVQCIQQPNVGLVHQMPFVEQRPGFQSVVQSVFFGGSHAKWYVFANCIGILCCTGMSCLMRKQPIDQLPGGLAYFGRYLAEDFFLASHFRSLGYKLALAHYPALQDSSGEMRGFRRRLMRWIKLRTAMMPHVVILELISECLLSGLLGAWTLTYLFPSIVNPYAYFLCHCLLWMELDYLLVQACLPPSDCAPFSRLAYVCAWAVCFCMLPLNVIGSLCQSDIVWRDKRFRLKWGGLTEQLSLQAHMADSASKQSV